MSRFVKKLHNNSIDTNLIAHEVGVLLHDYLGRNEDHTFKNPKQLSLSTKDPNVDDWAGYINTTVTTTPSERKQYNSICPTVVERTPYVAELLTRFPKYYGWRLMVLDAKTVYTIHADGVFSKNFRIHIPAITTPESLLLFFDIKKQDWIEAKISNDPNKDFMHKQGTITYHKMDVGSTYLFNASYMHSAMNGNKTNERIHIVGEKSYE